MKQSNISNGKSNIVVERIIASSKFQYLLQKKKKFIIPSTIFFFLFYFSLPILTSYTNYLNRPVLGALTLAWVFAFAQFLMTWGLCIIYQKKAKEFDTLVQEILEQESENKGGVAR